MKHALAVLFALALMMTAGCGKTAGGSTRSQSIIDWVDFVKLNDIMYGSIYSGVIADPSLVSETVVGTVQYNVSENVTNPNYDVKNGDAAFLAEGTELYTIKGLDPAEFIVAKDEHAVNGYKVYYAAGEKRKKTWHFKDLEQEKVQKIEVYEGYRNAPRIAVHEGEAAVLLLAILNESRTDQHYMPQTKEGDPKAFQLVFYDGAPIVQVHHIYKDDMNYYWSPWNTNIIDDAISDYLEHQQ